MSGALSWVKRHYSLLIVFSAVVLGFFGLLLIFDQLSRVSSTLVNWLSAANLTWLIELG